MNGVTTLARPRIPARPRLGAGRPLWPAGGRLL